MNTNIAKLTIACLLAFTTHASAQLVNLSTRGNVGPGQNVLIGGFILSGETTVIIRALGPTLENYGVTNVLADPSIGLFNETGSEIGYNDDWQNDLRASELGDMAPRFPAESAMKITLPAGRYTVVLAGPRYSVGGLALVEIYLAQ